MSKRLEVASVKVHYSGKVAVDQVSIDLLGGEIVAILGHNGAGKSSLLAAIRGHVACTGDVILDGLNLSNAGAEARLSAGLALVPQGHQVFAGLRVDENLKLAGLARTRRRALGIDAIYDAFPRLRERAYQRAGTLSGGEQQMLAIGMGLITNPSVILIDEPTIGLAPSLVKQVMDDLVKACRERDCSVLLVEQNVTAALSIADRAYGMRRGKIVYENNARNFTENFDLLQIM